VESAEVSEVNRFAAHVDVGSGQKVEPQLGLLLADVGCVLPGRCEPREQLAFLAPQVDRPSGELRSDVLPHSDVVVHVPVCGQQIEHGD
jgi:hypothetical protein